MNQSLPKLTARQEQILRFVQNFSNNNGFSPSIREIAEGVGLSSSSTVFLHLQRLQAKGVLKRQRGQTRSCVSKLRLITPRTGYVRALEEVARLARLWLRGELICDSDLDLALDFADQARVDEQLNA